ncbi:MAG: DUF1254 domain-containing protein [Geminicoccaceae bacterium]
MTFKTLTRRLAVGACALALAVGALPGIAFAAPTAEQARAIGVDAYTYLYSLVTMEITRQQLTNQPADAPGIGAPPNSFRNMPAYPAADVKAVVRPNFDTLYSSAWLDLSKGPVQVSIPDTNGRYYLLPMLDMWTDVFASPGWRTTGTGAQTYVVVPPGWTGQLPEGATPIQAPTPTVWIIGRIKTDGPADYDAVHKIQAGLKLTALGADGKPLPPQPFTPDPKVDMKTPPKVKVDSMTAGEFFGLAAEILKREPPHVTDQPILAQLAQLGFVVGQSFDLAKADPAVQQGLADVPAEAQRLMAWKVKSLARIANGWSMNTDTMGVYGNYYLKRAIVTQLGLGANLPEDAIYPMNLGDSSGQPLDGSHDYVLHFPAGQLPPAQAFWSVTLYDAEGFQVANPLNRFAISSWMPLVKNADGSLDLHFQHASPGAAREANWLPAPQGPFNLTMRLYAPASDALTGKWNPPAVERVDAVPTLAVQ